MSKTVPVRTQKNLRVTGRVFHVYEVVGGARSSVGTTNLGMSHLLRFRNLWDSLWEK